MVYSKNEMATINNAFFVNATWLESICTGSPDFGVGSNTLLSLYKVAFFVNGMNEPVS